MATPIPFLEQVIATQAAMQTAAVDTWALQTRYVFNPFRNEPFTIQQMQDYGMPSLEAGCVIPITKFNQRDKDYTEMLHVPRDWEGNFEPTNPGVSAEKLTPRIPAEVLDALLSVFNKHHGTDPFQDNGICEVTELRGNDDMALLLDINRHCLPGRYDTRRRGRRLLNWRRLRKVMRQRFTSESPRAFCKPPSKARNGESGIIATCKRRWRIRSIR
jgi:hypothetical protein